jgi:hypothetical protein
VVVPRGTWFDARGRAHTFWENVLCNLFHRRALNGADSARSALLATAGTLVSIHTPHERIPEAELTDIVFNRWARICARNRGRRAAYDSIFVGGYLDSQAKGALAVGARDSRQCQCQLYEYY